MNDVEVTVLDHIDKIAVPGNPFAEPSNQYWALICLRQGMEFLYRQARDCDQLMREKHRPCVDEKVFLMGNDPMMKVVPIELLSCAFQWYAISACQYARTIGTIAYQQDNAQTKPNLYVESVIPEVLAYRDKVAAHFAWTVKNGKDNDAERIASILPQLTFHDDSFYVGEMSVFQSKNGRETDSRVIVPWSICRVHEKLRERYWPSRHNTDVATDTAPS